MALKGVVVRHWGELRKLVPDTTPLLCEEKPVHPEAVGSDVNGSIIPPPILIEWIIGLSLVDSIWIFN